MATATCANHRATPQYKRISTRIIIGWTISHDLDRGENWGKGGRGRGGGREAYTILPSSQHPAPGLLTPPPPPVSSVEVKCRSVNKSVNHALVSRRLFEICGLHLFNFVA